MSFTPTSVPPKPLPTASLEAISPGISLLPPLSRRGHGPGLILLVPDTAEEQLLAIEDGVPSHMTKWAEEGYVVLSIQASALKKAPDVKDMLVNSISALEAQDKCDNGTVGLVAYDPELFNLVVPVLSLVPSIAGAVVYADASSQSSLEATATTAPVLRHFASPRLDSIPAQKNSKTLATYYYPSVASYLFATPFQPHFNYSTEALSHTRNLTFLKKLMDGPWFDLEHIWEEHCFYEFDDRSVEHTMSTMVAEPYVNHVPTLTGGIGRTKLTNFYAHHFIFANSPDTQTEVISRTIGIDRIVDEMSFSFTHNQMVDWLLPGVPQTGKKVELIFYAVVNIRGDRLYHEHIAWDQASALRQVGLLPEYLPYTYTLPEGYALPDGRVTAAEGKQLYYKLPVSGAEAAEKLKDREALESNLMFKYGIVEK
ncbi:hypothetical protein B0H66DRAFT_553085 [Apodospora peruviana]|uniref:Carboxymethylenebutenolidase n=1 Tax=Apodospora peruviana TaxID=516989 RepID=A0AAE0IC60_9PEZI|nr:hypothetical protein B0H66DRAFT_553085 [Apodospora peruviana]